MRTEIGETMTFGIAGNAEASRLHGWAGPENGFAWTLDGESGVRLAEVAAPHGCFIELFVHPGIAPGIPHQRIGVSMNGHEIGADILHQRGIYAYYCPAGCLARDNVLTITHPDYYRGGPGETNGAFAFNRLRVLPLTSPLAHIEAAVSAHAAGDAAAAERITGVPVRDLVTGFEMLSGNCGFGLMQRDFDAEPLGLLRFMGAEQNVAIEMLDNDFAGLGQNISCFVSNDEHREWMISDSVYSLYYHTMVLERDASEAEILQKESRKIEFLRRKMLSDLETPSKIYLFVDRFGMPRSAAIALQLALRRKAGHPLLWVCEGDRFSEQVEVAGDGLTKAYLTVRDRGNDREIEEIDRQWLTVLTNAWLLNGRGP